MENDSPGAVGVVLYKLISWDGPPSLSERIRLGPPAQLISLYDTGVPPQLHPDGTFPVPPAAHSYTIAPPRDTYQSGSDFCGDPPGGAKTDGVRGKRQRVDLGRNMEAC